MVSNTLRYDILLGLFTGVIAGMIVLFGNQISLFFAKKSKKELYKETLRITIIGIVLIIFSLICLIAFC